MTSGFYAGEEGNKNGSILALCLLEALRFAPSFLRQWNSRRNASDFQASTLLFLLASRIVGRYHTVSRVPKLLHCCCSTTLIIVGSCS